MGCSRNSGPLLVTACGVTVVDDNRVWDIEIGM